MLKSRVVAVILSILFLIGCSSVPKDKSEKKNQAETKEKVVEKVESNSEAKNNQAGEDQTKTTSQKVDNQTSKEAPKVMSNKKSEAKEYEKAIIKTVYGNIVFEFYKKDAPNTVDNFIKLTKQKFYNGLKFHRVVPGFVVQGGDPRGDGTGGPGYKIKAEFNSRSHLTGTVAMARSSHPDSAGSQFYICLAPQPSLDGQYTVFGQVRSGMEFVKQIKQGDIMQEITLE